MSEMRDQDKCERRMEVFVKFKKKSGGRVKGGVQVGVGVGVTMKVL